jgi:PAS domain S-box-containing protein
MPGPLRALLLDDSPDDAELIAKELSRAGFEPELVRVDKAEGFERCLKEDFQIVLLDFTLPGFGGIPALQLLKQHAPHLPCIMVSGSIGDETAAECIRRGAYDYVLKDHLQRLGSTVQNAMEHAQLQSARQKAEDELAHAVEALRATEQTYRRAIAAIGAVPYSYVHGEDRFTFIGEGITNLTGWPVEEITPSVWKAMIGDALMRGEAAGLPWREAWRRLQIGQIRNWNCDVRIKTRDGLTRWISDGAVSLLDESNRVTGYVGVLQDITERKEAEQKVRDQASLLDLASDSICLTNMNQEVVFWNRASERIYDWPAAEALGRNVTDLLFKGDGAKPNDVIKSLIRNQQWSGEVRQFKRAGQEIVVESRWTLVRNDNGQPRGILIMGSDITEKKKLESQFLRAQRLESIGTLASGIAHDLNNVLAPILMSIDLLQDALSNEKEHGILSSMETSARRGAEIVKHLLTFARGIEGKRILIQTKHLIAELATILRGTIPKDISITTSTSPDLWVVLGDSTQLHQVLLNLCVNARDAMPKGGTLRITAGNVELDEQYTSMSPEAKAGPYVRIDVIDTGAGIPPEHLDKIFDPFFTTKEPGMGTGLGLSSTIGILKSHGGFVTVQSQLDQGTTFSIYLPARPFERDDAQVPRTAAADGGLGELVLVVDDEASIRNVTQRTLQHRGYRTLVAEDGAQALALFVQHQEELDIVITDLAMPFMDGLALVRAIKKMRPTTRIIISTGHGQSEKIAELKSMGLRTFLNKPYTADRLLSALREELSSS